MASTLTSPLTNPNYKSGSHARQWRIISSASSWLRVEDPEKPLEKPLESQVDRDYKTYMDRQSMFHFLRGKREWSQEPHTYCSSSFCFTHRWKLTGTSNYFNKVCPTESDNSFDNEMDRYKLNCLHSCNGPIRVSRDHRKCVHLQPTCFRIPCTRL